MLEQIFAMISFTNKNKKSVNKTTHTPESFTLKKAKIENKWNFNHRVWIDWVELDFVNLNFTGSKYQNLNIDRMYHNFIFRSEVDLFKNMIGKYTIQLMFIMTKKLKNQLN